ncbi:MAG: hypothetical protein Q8K65_10410 [Alphaproteobacteria bacterium]|nr:hypothetical protein [Alphaproteobacteria bacterium]
MARHFEPSTTDPAAIGENAVPARAMLVKPFEKADLLRAVSDARQENDKLFFSK